MLDCLIVNGMVVPVEPAGEAFVGHVGIKDGRIALIGRGTATSVRATKVLDATNQILMPGLVNAHIHPSPSFLRGLVSHLTIEENDTDPFVMGIYREMTEEDAYHASCLTLLECLQTGTTSVGMKEYTRREAAMQAMHDVGLFGSFSVDVDASDADFERLVQSAEPMGVRLMLSGPNEDMPEYFKRGFLEDLRKRAEKYDVLIHIHVQETKGRTELVRKKTGKSPMAFLADLGLLARTYAVHCTMVDETDLNLLAANKVPVIVAPRAEAMVSDGVTPIKAMLNAGITLGLGTDGGAWTGSDDMFQEMKATAILNRAWGQPTDITSRQLLEMATLGGAKAMRMDSEIGSLDVGKRADIIFIDTRVSHMRPSMLEPVNNVIDLLAYSATGADVTRVMVAGQTQYQRGETREEREALLDKFQGLAERLYKRVLAGRLPQ